VNISISLRSNTKDLPSYTRVFHRCNRKSHVIYKIGAVLSPDSVKLMISHSAKSETLLSSLAIIPQRRSSPILKFAQYNLNYTNTKKSDWFRQFPTLVELHTSFLRLSYVITWVVTRSSENDRHCVMYTTK
jgi:hypothetical protein